MRLCQRECCSCCKVFCKCGKCKDQWGKRSKVMFHLRQRYYHPKNILYVNFLQARLAESLASILNMWDTLIRTHNMTNQYNISGCWYSDWNWILYIYICIYTYTCIHIYVCVCVCVYVHDREIHACVETLSDDQTSSFSWWNLFCLH